MMDIQIGALFFVGSLVSLAGVVSIAFLERLADNIARAGIVNRTSVSPKLFAGGLAVMQMGLGVFIVGLSVVLSGRGEASGSQALIDEIMRRMGPATGVTCVTLLISGVIALALGIANMRRVQKRREIWGSRPDRIEMPARDQLRVIGGTVAAVYGILAVGLGVCFIVAWSF